MAVGSDYFPSLVRTLATTLGVRYAFVCENLDQPVTKVHTLAAWLGDHLGTDIEYEVVGTPCLNTANGERTYYARDVQKEFPEDKLLVDFNAESYCGLPLISSSGQVIGHVAVMDEKPIETNLCEMPALQIFAARAAAELQRQQAELQLQQLHVDLAHSSRLNAMGEMAAGIGHELNQPLGAMAAYCETCIQLIQSGEAKDKDLLHALQKISDLTQRSGEIIQWLKRFSKKGRPQYSVIDMALAVDEVVELIQREAGQANVQVQVEMDSSPLPVEADAIQIQQVILNLVKNGIDAMMELEPAQRVLTIGASQLSTAEVEVRVHNRGTEIPPENIERVFEPFFTTKSEGLGLGLTISHSVVAALGGTFKVSGCPEGGVVFRFQLPSAQANST